MLGSPHSGSKVWKAPDREIGKPRENREQVSNVVESKSGYPSIRRPPGSMTASPQLGSCCIGDFLSANSTGTKRPVEEIGLRLLFQRSFFRWRSSVLKLKPRLWQNSLRRIPLLTNSATNC